MDRFSVHLDVNGDEQGRTYEFETRDAQAMLDWLEHDVDASSTRLSCNGQPSLELVSLGGGGGRYWMIVPDNGRT